MPDDMLLALSRKRDRFRRLASRPTPLRGYFRRRAEQYETARCAALLDRYKTSLPEVWIVPFDELARRARRGE